MMTAKEACVLIRNVGSEPKWDCSAEPECYDDAIDFQYKGTQCSAQVDPYTNVVVGWNRYIYDASGLTGMYSYDSLPEMIAKWERDHA